MYKCCVTGKMTRPHAKMNRLVVQTRPKVYTEWFKEDGEWVEIEIGRGYETVKEIQASDEGVRVFNEMSDLQKDELLRKLGIPGQYGLQQ